MKQVDSRASILQSTARVALVTLLAVMITGVASQMRPAFAPSTAEWDWFYEPTGDDATREYNAEHDNHLVIKDMRIPFVYVNYPNGQNIYDPLGISLVSKLDHGPHEHILTAPQDGMQMHTTYRVGASCPVDPNNHPFYGCYKYVQNDYFLDSDIIIGNPVSPKFKHYLTIYGEGFPDQGGMPIYNVWWRVDTDLPVISPGNDLYRHRTGTSTWTPITIEAEMFDDFSGGYEWQTIDTPAADNLVLDPRNFDIARFVALLQKPSEINPPVSNPWPCANWCGPENIDKKDIVYWYRGQAGGCTVTNPCATGPTLVLNGGL